MSAEDHAWPAGMPRPRSVIIACPECRGTGMRETIYLDPPYLPCPACKGKRAVKLAVSEDDLETLA